MDFFTNLADVVHYLFGRNHIQQILKSKVYVRHSLTALRIDQREQHFQKIVILINSNFRNRILRNTLRLFQCVDYLLVCCIKKGVHTW
ncbi:hypothetical protein D1872_214600 [compost metagenome]